MRHDKAGSNVLATDYFRDSNAGLAANVIEAGGGRNLKSADHNTAGELCTSVIVRRANDVLNRGSADIAVTEDRDCLAAAHKLREGLGVHKAQADHAGGNTCANVISKATQLTVKYKKLNVLKTKDMGPTSYGSLSPGDMKVAADQEMSRKGLLALTNSQRGSGQTARMPKPRRELFKQGYYKGSHPHADMTMGDPFGVTTRKNDTSTGQPGSPVSTG